MRGGQFVLWLGVLSLLIACKPTVRKLDEAEMYAGQHYQLKLVRYYENYPMHYTGEVFTVQCKSAATSALVATKTQDAGWKTVGNGGAIGSSSATQMVDSVRSKYLVINDSTLVWTGVGFNISFNACGSFRSWYPTTLPSDQIDTVPKPEYCAPVGTADCRGHDFLGDRSPRFSEVRVDDSTVAFSVESPAFRAGKLRVRSSDAGTTWKVDARPPR